MNVLFAGQTGIHKNRVLENLASAIGGFCGSGKTPDQLRSEKILGIYEAESVFDAAPYGLSSWLEEEYRALQESHWNQEVGKLLKIIAGDGNKNNFLSFHAVYRRYREYFSPISLDLLEEFKPDLMITFIDDVYDVAWRLKQDHGATKGDSFELGEIIEWRGIEVMVMDRLSSYLVKGPGKIPHYVVAIKHPAKMLAKLILFPKLMRLYTAYPITGLRGVKEEQENLEIIDEYRSYMHENYIAFDPNTIDEFWFDRLITRREKDVADGKDIKGTPYDLDMEITRWPMRSKILDLPQLSDGVERPKKLLLEEKEVEDVAESAKQQIATRDYRLISQANAMTAFRPLFRGNASTGVIRELGYAKLAHTRAYQFWEEKDGDGNPEHHPFLSKGIFTSNKDEWYQWLRDHQETLDKFPRHHAHHGEFSGC